MVVTGGVVSLVKVVHAAALVWPAESVVRAHTWIDRQAGRQGRKEIRQARRHCARAGVRAG